MFVLGCIIYVCARGFVGLCVAVCMCFGVWICGCALGRACVCYGVRVGGFVGLWVGVAVYMCMCAVCPIVDLNRTGKIPKHTHTHTSQNNQNTGPDALPHVPPLLNRAARPVPRAAPGGGLLHLHPVGQQVKKGAVPGWVDRWIDGSLGRGRWHPFNRFIYIHSTTPTQNQNSKPPY